jgi:hypothetical protein
MNKIKIGKPCSPSKLIDKEIFDAHRILVSYGGGMGGANQKFYTRDFSENDNELIFTDIENRKLTVNKRFIVLKEPVRLVRTLTDTTKHSNYRKTTVANSQVIQYRVLYPNDTYEFVDDYVSSSNDKSLILTQRSEVEL